MCYNIFSGLLISILVPQMTEAVYYPPQESEGGWRSLVSPNEAPTSNEKQKLTQTTGLDWDKLYEAWKYCESFDGTNSLLVIRHGWIAGEWHNYTEPRGIASCTKSLTGLAIAKLFDLSDAGKLAKHTNIDDEVWQFLPTKWVEAEPERKHIKIRNMLTMTSGLTPYDGPYEADYEEKVFAQKVEASSGTVWAYASVPVDMLSLVIENVSGQKMGDFFNEYINNVIGTAPIEWGEFSGHTGGSGGPGGGTKFPPRELARVGYMVLHDGVWEKDGQQNHVISKMRLREFTRKASWLENTKWRQPNFAFEPYANRYYGHLWWNNSTGQALGEATPRDIVYMSGWGKQACFVVPVLDMIVIRLGPNRTLNEHPEFYHGLWKRLMEAVTDREE